MAEVTVEVWGAGDVGKLDRERERARVGTTVEWLGFRWHVESVEFYFGARMARFALFTEDAPPLAWTGANKQGIEGRA